MDELKEVQLTDKEMALIGVAIATLLEVAADGAEQGYGGYDTAAVAATALSIADKLQYAALGVGQGTRH